MITSSGNMDCIISLRSGGPMVLMAEIVAIAKLTVFGLTKRNAASFYSKSNTRTQQVRTGKWKTSTCQYCKGISLRVGSESALLKLLNGTTAQSSARNDQSCERG